MSGSKVTDLVDSVEILGEVGEVDVGLDNVFKAKSGSCKYGFEVLSS